MRVPGMQSLGRVGSLAADVPVSELDNSAVAQKNTLSSLDVLEPQVIKSSNQG